MRPLVLLVSSFLVGCQACPGSVPCLVEAHVAAVAAVQVNPDPPSCPEPVPDLDGPLDLPALWDLALVHNPSLREAAAEVEVSRGRLIQASLYPNPRLLYDQDTIGSRIALQGNIMAQVNQEIVTSGKRRLDMAVADRETDTAHVALLARKFEVLTRIRRSYYDFLGWAAAERANAEVVAVLERGAGSTRRLVEETKVRPRTDLLRIEALLAEARISLARSTTNRAAAWQQLAAEVGVPGLPSPPSVPESFGPIPDWNQPAIADRVLAANTALKQAGVEAERARLALQRAKAQAVPNITVGGGYNADNTDQTAGGLVTVETALPLWDRNQGNIHAAQATWVQAQAAVQTTATRLSREAAAAFAGYQAGRQQVEQLATEVLPRLQESVKLLRQGYVVGAGQVAFTDVLLAEQSFFTAQVTLAEARRALWLAVADLEGLMQLDVGEEFCLGTDQPG